MGDKRRLERFSLTVPAQLRYRDRTGAEQRYATQTRNISAEGAYFHFGEHEVPIGAQVEVELVLTFERLKELLNAADRVTARVEGRILREEPDGVVVVFNQPFRFFPEPDLQPA
ncbi:MAG: PilZ domain-containing protein [Spirochaetaceae bacterium]